MSLLRRFNPYGMDDGVVDRLATGRETVLDDLLVLVRQNLASRPKQHALLTAPRGFGKSFLMRLVQNRLRDEPRIAVALLPEEQRNVRRAPLLPQEILRVLDGRPPSDVRIRWSQDNAAWADAVTALDASIAARVGPGGMLVAIIENFDQLIESVFHQHSDQQLLRGWLAREGGQVMLLATATRQVDDDYAKPLFRAFTPFHMEPWGEADCLAFYDRVRAETGSAPLSDGERARTCAVAMFAGGSPRIATVLYDVLQNTDADRAAALLDALVDELSDYYRNRIDSLSPRAQDVLDTLLRLDEAKSQSVVAAALGESQNRVAEVFRELLADQIIVGTPASDSRETLYRLADRLMAHFYRTRYFDPQNRVPRLAAIVDLLAVFLSAPEKQAFAKRLQAEGRAADAFVIEGLLRKTRSGTAPGDAGELDAATVPAVGAIAALAQAQSADSTRTESAVLKALLDLGTEQSEQGQHDAAITTLRRAAAAAEASGDSSRQITALILVAFSQGERNLHRAAVSTLQEAVTVAKAAGDGVLLGWALSMLGLSLGTQRQHDAAIAAFNESREVAKAAGDQKGYAFAVRFIGVSQAAQKKHELAIASLGEAVALAKAAGDTKGQTDALRYMGRSHVALEQNEAAIVVFIEAAGLYAAAGDSRSQAKVLQSMAEIYAKQSNPEQALSSLRDAIALLVVLNDRSEQAKVLRDIARIEAGRGRHDAAIATLTEVLMMPDFGEGEDHKAEALLAIASSRFELRQYDEGMAAIKDAKKISSETTDLHLRLIILIFIGMAQHWEGKYKQGIENLEEAYRLSQITEAPIAQIHSLNLLAVMNAKMELYDISMNYINKAINISKSTEFSRVHAHGIGETMKAARSKRGAWTGVASAFAIICGLWVGEDKKSSLLPRYFEDALAVGLRVGQFADIWAIALANQAAFSTSEGSAAEAVAQETAAAFKRDGRAAGYAIAAQAILPLAAAAVWPPPADAFSAAGFLRDCVNALLRELTDPALLRDIADLLDAHVPDALVTERKLLRARALDLERPDDLAALEREDPDIATAVRRLRGVTDPKALSATAARPVKPRKRKPQAKRPN